MPITYYINNRPFTFLVQAEAVAVSLELSTKVLTFEFSEDTNDTEMPVKKVLEVTNHGNAPARFSWENSKIYMPFPLSDIVPPGESRQVTVDFIGKRFNKSGHLNDEEVYIEKIEDRNDEDPTA